MSNAADRTAFESKGHAEHHVCFCGPCSTRIIELESELSRIASLKQKLVDSNYDLSMEVERLQGIRRDVVATIMGFEGMEIDFRASTALSALLKRVAINNR